MKKKGLLIVLTVLLTCFMLASCGGSNTSGGGGAASTGKKIFASNAYYTAPYCAPLNKGLQDAAAELGYELQIVDGEESADKQLSQFKAAVAEGYDGLIYFPADSASTPPVVEYLNSTGLPWVLLNTDVDESVKDDIITFVAIDPEVVGRDLANMAKDYLPNGGKAVYIEGAAGSSYVSDVTATLMKELEGSGIEILNDHQYADWDPGKAMKIMEDFLSKYGADGIDLLIAQDGGMFQGALSALDAAGLKGKLMACAQGNDLIIKESLLDGSLLATSLQDPFLEGSKCMETMDKLMKGETVDKWVRVPQGMCYAEDVEQYNWF